MNNFITSLLGYSLIFSHLALHCCVSWLSFYLLVKAGRRVTFTVRNGMLTCFYYVMKMHLDENVSRTRLRMEIHTLFRFVYFDLLCNARVHIQCNERGRKRDKWIEGERLRLKHRIRQQRDCIHCYAFSLTCAIIACFGKIKTKTFPLNRS